MRFDASGMRWRTIAGQKNCVRNSCRRSRRSENERRARGAGVSQRSHRFYRQECSGIGISVCGDIHSPRGRYDGLLHGTEAQISDPVSGLREASGRPMPVRVNGYYAIDSTNSSALAGRDSLMKTAVAACAALFIAAGFVCVGDLLLRRRSRGMFSLNESFLVGSAALGTMVCFQSPLVAGALTVDIVAIIIISATGGWLARHRSALTLSFRRGADDTTSALSRLRIWYSETSPLAFVLFVVLLAYLLAFCVISLKHAIVSDGLHIWASKAVVLYHQGVTRQLWSDGGYESRVTGYPFLIPLYEALVGKFIGGLFSH